jgi:lipopolysaccharide transport system permease protein
LFLAALNVNYRDVRYIVPFIVQFWLFISPVAFTTANVPERWRPLYALNPLVGALDGFRWSILGGTTPLYPQAVALSVAITVFLLLLGVWYFRRMERSFADVI